LILVLLISNYFSWQFCQGFDGFKFHHSIYICSVLFFLISSLFFWLSFCPFVSFFFQFNPPIKEFFLPSNLFLILIHPHSFNCYFFFQILLCNWFFPLISSFRIWFVKDWTSQFFMYGASNLMTCVMGFKSFLLHGFQTRLKDRL